MCNDVSSLGPGKLEILGHNTVSLHTREDFAMGNRNILHSAVVEGILPILQNWRQVQRRSKYFKVTELMVGFRIGIDLTPQTVFYC